MRKTKQQYIDDIKLMLTGGVLELEMEDEVIGKYLDTALEEVQRYIDTTVTITVPFAKVIDLTNSRVSSVTKVYRTEGYTGDTTQGMTTSEVDPIYAQQWMAFSNGGTMYNLNNYILNYLSWNTLLQMKNTMSTEMNFKEILHDKGADGTEDKHTLYVNAAYDRPPSITIEYVPLYLEVEDITSDYWVDILRRLALAYVKIGLGRVRTYSKQSNALYTLDGDTILAEGLKELEELREVLRTNATMFYPLD